MPDVATLQRLEPATAADVARMLREADDQRLAVLVRGHGTKVGWGRPPSRVDVILSTTGLREPIDHCAGDLTVTAPAGATLGEVNARLAREGQCLPLDPWAGDGSSIGGLLATNDSGPRRHRYGAPRDLVIGVEFALVDGRLAKAGGRVVKNVAGYDLGRLLCGSLGTLAVVTAATFKLAPLAPASQTVAVEAPDWPSLAPLLAALAASSLTPSAVEVSGPAPRLLVRYETTAAAADVMAATTVRLAGQQHLGAARLAGREEEACWRAHADAMAIGAATTLLRLGVLPTQVSPILSALDRRARELGVHTRVTGRGLLGALLLIFEGDDHAVCTLVNDLHETLTGSPAHVAILAAPDAVKGRLPRSPDTGGAPAVMRAIKAQFDPHGTLCPGGGPEGLA